MEVKSKPSFSTWWNNSCVIGLWDEEAVLAATALGIVVRKRTKKIDAFALARLLTIHKKKLFSVKLIEREILVNNVCKSRTFLQKSVHNWRSRVWEWFWLCLLCVRPWYINPVSMIFIANFNYLLVVVAEKMTGSAMYELVSWYPNLIFGRIIFLVIGPCRSFGIGRWSHPNWRG